MDIEFMEEKINKMNDGKRSIRLTLGEYRGKSTSNFILEKKQYPVQLS